MISASPSLILATYLIGASLVDDPTAMSPDWPCYYGFEPDDNDDAVTIYDTAGEAQGRLIATGVNYLRYGLQVRVRSRDYQDGWEQIQTLANALQTVFGAHVTIGADSFTILGVEQTATPESIGIELGAKRRHLFTLNLLLTFADSLVSVPMTPGSTPDDGDVPIYDAATGLYEPGPMRSSAPTIVPKTVDYVVLTSDSPASLFTTAGASGNVKFTLPAGANGLFYRFVVLAAHRLTVQASGSDVIRNGDDSSSAGGTIYSSSIGDSLELVYAGSAWVALAAQGAWTTS